MLLMFMEYNYITDYTDTGSSKIPRVKTTLSLADIIGALLARLTIDYGNYSVEPGLYAAGSPTKDSPVFVSANYKMSFDFLRKELKNIDCWILVLDTKGVNVWCAAGKGTFGTDELVSRISDTELEKIVNHKKVILPQLGAVGVSAHQVKKSCGFTVIYGPIRAADIKSFLEKGMKASREMRQVRFTLLNRLVLAPAEFVMRLKYIFALALFFFIMSGISRTGYSLDSSLSTGAASMVNLFTAYLAGTIAAPILLPYIPGRSFSVKGLFIGAAAFFVLYLFRHAGYSVIEKSLWFLIICAISSFLTMNFTGSSTYTSLSGVKKEMRTAMPLQIIAVSAGIILFIGTRFI